MRDQRFGQYLCHDRRKAKRQCAAQFSVIAGQVAQDTVGIGQQPFGPRQKTFSLLGRFDTAAVTTQKSHAQFLFKRLNLPTQRRLGDIQPLGSCGDTAHSADTDKISKLTQFHDAAMLSLIDPQCI